MSAWKTLTRDELRPFLEKSNTAAWRVLAFNWGLIAASFSWVMWAPSWFSVLGAMLILGGRQLGLGILTHECAHRSFMTSPPLVEWIGTWLCGAPMLVDLEIYRRYHMTHHMKTGTEGDPDLANYDNYPVSQASLARKLLRDAIGLSGFKALLSLLVLYSRPSVTQNASASVAVPAADTPQGYSYKTSTASAKSEENRPNRLSQLRTVLWNLRRIATVQLLMLGLCWALGHAEVYLLWPASWLTTYMLYSRIRNAAEHGALPGTRSDDMWRNTRTIGAAWWERLTVAPNFVNFHFEHHLAPTVPCYNLPKLHRWLREKGAYEHAQYEPNYVQVVQRLIGHAPPISRH